MSLEFVLAWLAVMFPLIFSPGPANITFAAAGASLGIRGSLPLLAGIDIVFLVKALLVGFGFMGWLIHYPLVMTILQWTGSIYLIYLAYVFIQPSKAPGDTTIKSVSIWQGMFIQSMNIKAWMIVITMFSVFAPKQGEGAESSVITLIIMITILNLITHFSWITFGRTLSKALASDKNRSLQNKFFALSLLLVAVWLAADNPAAISLTAG
ncbi:LysE family translocator [Microbulbifer sp. JMSA004]|uniref:LysE family translocator n=1 Tax=unclassified Microbulbifer TaxID=2619833 RepID=UPI0024AE28A2|nr:LysE family translocator [Microbulbifer sp. VAAF005]WHI46245.1 LysE family translocator [Microbulbifer sp. VAAF005]